MSEKKDDELHIGIHGHDDGSIGIDAHLGSECPALARGAGGDRKGPAKVATAAYRDGFDRIFGGRAEVGVA